MAGYIRQSTFVDGDTITAALFNNEYNQLVNAFSNTSGHKHDGTTAEGPVIGLIGDAGETSPNNKVLIDTTNNYIEFYVEVSSAPVQQLYIADGAIIPVTDSDIDLGTTSLRFKDTYTDTVTTTGNVSIGGDLTVTGSATISGNLTFGDADTDSINLAAEIDSDIIPNTDGTYDLGSATKEWQDLYIDGTANIDSLVADTADINGGTIDGATIATSDITVGAGKTLNVSAGTLTLADNQISGDKVEGGTIAATTITTLTSTTGNITNVNATTLDTTNIEVTNLKAKDGTSAGSIANTTGVVTLGSSVLTTTDINGGTIDGATIGGTTAGAVTFTDLSDGTITIAGFADEDNMVSNSATLLPTQQSVKAYVDSQVTAQDLDFQGDTGGALSIDLDSESLTIAGGTGIDTSGATNTLTVAIDSTVATLTGTQTLTNKTLTTPIISSISNTGTLTLPTSTDTLVGRATTDTLTNKTLTSPTLTSPVINTGVSGTAFLDDDTFATATASTLASSESIKAYVDTTVAATNEVVEDSTPQLGGDLDLNSNDITGTGNINITGTIQSSGNITGTLATAAQPNITSVGTLTALTGGTGDLNWDSGTLFVDSSANSVGIGTTSPASLLEIETTEATVFDGTDTGGQSSNGSTLAIQNLSDTNNTFSQILFRNRSTSKAVSRIASLTDGTGTKMAFVVENNGSPNEVLRIDKTGNVGIGTDSPDSDTKLHIQGTDGASGASTNVGANELFIDNNGNTGVTVGTSTTGTGYYAFADSDVALRAGIFYDHSTDDMGFRVASGTAMTIDSSRNVGIGTTSPSVALEVGDGTPTINWLRLNGTTSDLYIGQNTGFSHFGQTNATKILSVSNHPLAYGTANDYPLIFGVNDSEQMRLTSTGLGIGESSPENILHIKKAASGSSYSADGSDLVIIENNSSAAIDVRTPTGDSGGILFSDTTRARGAIIYYHSLDDMYFNVAGTSGAMVLDSSGNVGIGTTSPSSYNSIMNNLVIAGSADSGITIASGTSSEGSVAFADGTSGADAYRGWINYNHGSNFMRFFTNAAERMRIDGSGNVGIGTSTIRLSEKLHVLGQGIVTSSAEDTNMGLFGTFGTSTQIIGSFNNIPVIFRQNNTERMRIDSGGEILIGDTARRGTNWRGQLQVTQIDATNAAGISCISGNDEIAGTFSLYSSSTNSAAVSIDPDNLRSSSNFYVIIDNIQRANFDASGNLTITGSYSSSDRTKKENIVTLPSQLETVKQLNPVSFDWIERAEDGSTKSSLGFIAQEVEELYPDLVHTPEADPDMPSKDTTKHLNYAVMTAILTKAIQEQQAQIEALQSEINELKNS